MNTNQTTKAEELAKPEPCCWASENVIPLRGLKDNHPTILTATRCAANTIPLYREPPAPAVPDGWKIAPYNLTKQMSDAFKKKSSDGLQHAYWALLGAAPQPPAVSDDKPEPDYKAMFHRAVADIALIEEALGIPEEESGKSAHHLAEAAKELRRQVFSYESMVADRDERLANLWRPIETAPMDGTEVLVHQSNNEFFVAYCFKHVWRYGNDENFIDTPTHWMPLPKPPIDAMREGDPS